MGLAIPSGWVLDEGMKSITPAAQAALKTEMKRPIFRVCTKDKNGCLHAIISNLTFLQAARVFQNDLHPLFIDLNA